MPDAEPDQLANESWFNSRWRPAMAWLYFTVCAFDFLVFPIFNAILQPDATAATFHEWRPLTLQGGGLFHVAMGGIVGAAVWTRTREKLAIYGGGGSIDTENSAGSGAPQMPKSSRAD